MRQFRAWWGRAVRWTGWTAWLRWSGWRTLAAWRGWKTIFCIHPALTVLVSLLAAAGLFWVFWNGYENSVPAVAVYVLSAYALTVLAVRLPGAVNWGKALLHRNPRAEQALQDEELHFTLSLYLEQMINCFYGVFKTAAGIILGTAWIGADGLYNLIQAIIQLFQILRRRKHSSMVQQWKSYRLCGWLTLVMHLTVTGLVYQMTQMGRFEDYPGFMIFATAAFVFYKLISAVVDVARDRKHKKPIDSAVRYLDLSQAFYNIFSLQVALLHAFGVSGTDYRPVNMLTGGVVCVLIVGMGIYMIHRANRELKKLE